MGGIVHIYSIHLFYLIVLLLQSLSRIGSHFMNETKWRNQITQYQSIVFNSVLFLFFVRFSFLRKLNCIKYLWALFYEGNVFKLVKKVVLEFCWVPNWKFDLPIVFVFVRPNLKIGIHLYSCIVVSSVWKMGLDHEFSVNFHRINLYPVFNSCCVFFFWFLAPLPLDILHFEHGMI